VITAPHGEPELPRPLAFILGLIFILFAILSVFGGIAMFQDPGPVHPLLGYLSGVILLLLAIVVILWGGRMVLNRRTQSGGLLSAWGLRLGGLLLLALPIGGLFVGAYSEPGYRSIRILQAVIYVGFGLLAFRLARARKKPRGVE
jgi:hypothetical protein